MSVNPSAPCYPKFVWFRGLRRGYGEHCLHYGKERKAETPDPTCERGKAIGCLEQERECCHCGRRWLSTWGPASDREITYETETREMR